MTETDNTRRPLEMPEKFIPYMEKHRIYKLFKDMMQDLVINLPKDHLKHMKVYLNRRLQSHREPINVILLVSPQLKIDIDKVVRDMIKDLGLAVITRRYIMDQYEMHDDFVPGCVSISLLSAVTRTMTTQEPVPVAGWLMFDHPCSVREARGLQQVGVLPDVTLLLEPPPMAAPPADDPHTGIRNFFQQDFEGLKFVYKATLKEVHVYPTDDTDKVSNKCFNAIRACLGGAQGPGQGHHVVGAPGTYRVLIIGPRGSGRHTQAQITAKHFGLVYLNFDKEFAEALEKNDDIGDKMRNEGISDQLRLEIIKRRLLQQDCIERGWALTGFPNTSAEFENLERTSTPPNRVIILNVDYATCKNRISSRAIDWCTGGVTEPGAPRAISHPRDTETNLDTELDVYFSETLAEMRAAVGMTALEVNGKMSLEQVQTKIQAAIISAPSTDIECGAKIRHARGD